MAVCLGSAFQRTKISILRLKETELFEAVALQGVTRKRNACLDSVMHDNLRPLHHLLNEVFLG